MSESNRKLSPRNHPLPRSPLTRAIHSEGSGLQDITTATFGPAVGPDITVSTTFRIQPPSDLVALQQKLGELHAHSGLSSNNANTPSLSGPGDSSHSTRSPLGSLHAYRRHSQPVLAQTEKTLGSILNGEVLVYSSGLSAAFAALMHLSPDVIAIRDGYRGCHETIKRYCQLRGMNERNSVEVKVIDLDDAYPLPESGLRVLVWLETPVNPTGECRDIQAYARKVRQCSAGSELLVDSTLAPPPLSNPFAFGADLVLYSGSKYFGGHSDTLCGILVTHKSNPSRWRRLWNDRTHLGMLPGSLESWLLLRSIKTLQLRVIHQSDTATRLAVWLNSLTERDYRSDTDPDETRRLVTRVWHSSFQDGGRWVGFDSQTNAPRQMMGGGSPCFSFMLRRAIHAKWLPYLTQLFIPATSVGGVESLIQHQVQAEPSADPRIVRISVGLEDFQDLKNDLIQAFDKVIRYERHHSKL
ncbi:hypothetical protein PTTG_02710 [Puccinia triticina 1-1 BBBD Race 1]|uniref:Cystathionine gamma-synthase n=2 Tax=Puccinia triticina TaxID=208348 RepID=A0A180GKE9_PUCT1|nr:uncharacterized protein PtA15_6A669 [Puccinia triticina]OAV92929.1 hypothetical protein PTTG_02710 [Puccinia triticina 1-1 BBBD Race 1]WAQ86039.1 hypothetical protein PtA15_6A669 [Puccinia triticina]